MVTTHGGKTMADRRTHFRGFARVAAASMLAAAAAGCTEDDTVARRDFTAGASGTGEVVVDERTAGAWRVLPCEVDAHTFARAVDFAALYQSAQYVLYGTACRTATDEETCESAVDELARATHLTPFLILTAGDEVLRVQGPHELLPWLGGSIDSEREAALAAMLSGLPAASCDGGARAFASRIRQVSGGYEIKQTLSTCDGYATYTSLVDARGQMTDAGVEGNTCISDPSR